MIRSILAGLFALGLAACTSTGDTMHKDGAAGPDVKGKVVTYRAGGAELTGFLAWDENRTGKRPGVLVVHEWWGHNEYVRERARQLAAMGYTALALDMYGDGKQASHPADAKKFMTEVLSNMDLAKARFRAAMDLLEQQPTVNAEDMAAIGYCFGGAVVLNMARLGFPLDGVASFHGNLSTQSPASKGAVKARVLVLHGADDTFIPQEQIDAFKAEMEAADVDYEFIAYPGALHSFTSKAADENGQKFNLPLAYNAEADRKSWAELDRFLVELFGPRP